MKIKKQRNVKIYTVLQKKKKKKKKRLKTTAKVSFKISRKSDMAPLSGIW